MLDTYLFLYHPGLLKKYCSIEQDKTPALYTQKLKFAKDSEKFLTILCSVLDLI